MQILLSDELAIGDVTVGPTALWMDGQEQRHVHGRSFEQALEFLRVFYPTGDGHEHLDSAQTTDGRSGPQAPAAGQRGPVRKPRRRTG